MRIRRFLAIGLALIAFFMPAIGRAEPLGTVRLERFDGQNRPNVAITALQNWAFEVDGDVSFTTKLLQRQYLNKVPANIRDRFFQNGGRMILTTQDIAVMTGSPELKGRVLGAQNGFNILIMADDTAIRRCTLHEWGHFLDYQLKYVSRTEDFKQMYRDNINRWVYIGGYGGLEEFFAEAFQQSILDEEYFSRKYPDLYDFMQKNISNIR